MKRAYKFRAYPTHPQEARATQLLADHCDLYNAALEERREAWRMRGANITYSSPSARLTQIRAGDKHGQGRHSFTAQQQTLRRLNVVFQGFYDRCRSGQAPGYPRFKPYGRFGHEGPPAQVHPGHVKTVQLKREHRRWYVIVVADCAPLPQSPTGRLVGVDLGVARFLRCLPHPII